MATIRHERPGDIAAIHALTNAAFATASYGTGTEGTIVDAMRAAGDMSLSLVAVVADEIVGHVAFSPVQIGGDHAGWFGLGPVAVRPDRLRQGIGSRLIRDGLSQLDARGAAGVVLTGDPAYYLRFGFSNDGAVSYLDRPAKNVHRLILNGPPREGAIIFVPALHGA